MRTTDRGPTVGQAFQPDAPHQAGKPDPRAGFTLIELLVVIAIIGILMSLLAAAIMKARSKGRETVNKVELGQLDGALKEKFYQRFGFYPPSVIKLSENGVFTGNGQLDIDSQAIIQRMFKRINLAAGVDWNGDGAINGPWILTGDQCLVFFLGGIPSANGPLGFSDNPSNPAAVGGTRIGPFFEFRASRLYQRPNSGTGGTGLPAQATGFRSYRDAYEQKPFAYFSSYNTPNGYNPGWNGKVGYPGSAALPNLSDCPGLGYAGKELFPYQEAAGRFLNPNTFQIISAGLDGNFGLGSNPTLSPVPFWTTTSATAMYPTLPANERTVYQDDQANFARTILQAGP